MRHYLTSLPSYYLNKVLVSLGVVLTVSLLTACGGGSADVVQTPAPAPLDNAPITYSGPVASTPDVTQFKLALWDNISSQERCGACHVQDNQSPAFARNDDINLAYSAANALVNFTSPEDSALVSKVAGGHNCWLTSDAACADIMTTWITNWGATESTAKEIQLEAPVAKEPGANKNFPADAQLFADTVYPLLETYCANCHTNSATIPISPYFASSDIDEAYGASKARISLDTPGISRFVGRVRDEFHNCWSDCSDNANDLISAIQAMADGIAITELDGALINSKALTLFDGTLATGGGRFETDVIAKWEFKTGSGTTAFDTSGVEPAINLTLNGAVSWIGGWGIQLTNGKAQGSTTSSKKLHQLITATGEFAIEAWVVPANVTQEGPARIISYSGGADTRNFTLGQTLYNYNALLRTDKTDLNGQPALSTADAAEVLQASLQHVVINYDAVNGRQIFVNGQFTGDTDNTETGNFADWNDSYALVLGNEVSGDIPWSGSIRMVAIHNRTLSSEQVAQNFDVGIGQKFFLLFEVSDITNIAQSYVVLEVSQFDSYSYLFSEPFFVTLDNNASITDIPLQGMRIGINGRQASGGQVYQNLDTQLTQADYVAGQGQILSPLGTIIPVEKGAGVDEFFLTFEVLADQTNVVVEADPPAPAASADLQAQAQIGMRNFAEIHASMSAVTTVPMNNSAVKTAFEKLKQQLPSVTNMDGFLASNQMAVTQMAIKYCDQLVETQNLRENYFTGFDFSQNASSAFTTQDRHLILTPLTTNMLGTSLSDQPNDTDVIDELDNLITRLTDCSGDKVCDANYTKTVVKAVCAGALGSAAITMQ
ncbi:LamG domain-containing protein [Paraglaciecola sp. MB-3u-78]|uniref:LamG domain-containing protein n=1 Tax=Paraglaciecola sp. MB-3u-78 TaxID=2058332 RepID=UPI000C322625|nr:LamG domain-containing protein [Paraglaciecola sp. MB-3u-78]PKG98442.1 ATPase [Paraglaciecola sp. MB-3u-78]